MYNRSIDSSTSSALELHNAKPPCARDKFLSDKQMTFLINRYAQVWWYLLSARQHALKLKSFYSQGLSSQAFQKRFPLDDIDERYH